MSVTAFDTEFEIELPGLCGRTNDSIEGEKEKDKGTMIFKSEGDAEFRETPLRFFAGSMTTD